MQRSESSSDCWVDIFEADYFMGRRRRLQGPQKLRQLQAKSLIVGPKATVVLAISKGKKKSVVRLNAKRVIPELAKLAGGAIFREITVEISPS